MRSRLKAKILSKQVLASKLNSIQYPKLNIDKVIMNLTFIRIIILIGCAICFSACEKKQLDSTNNSTYQIDSPSQFSEPFPVTNKGESFQISNGDYIMNMGGGNYLNLRSGDYIMSMGGGDSMNLTTGQYIMNMGGGDSMNLTTGAYIMDMGGGDKLDTSNGDYIMNMGGGDSMNLTTGAYIMDMGGGDKMVIGGDD